VCHFYLAEEVVIVPKHYYVRFERKTGLRNSVPKIGGSIFGIEFCQFFPGSRLRAEIRKVKLFEASRSGDRISPPPHHIKIPSFLLGIFI
jgi:hypothetical protein